MLRLGTTFSGIGAPEQALKNLKIDFETEWACDIDSDCKKTYLANHGCRVWYNDICDIDVQTLSNIDLYVFGFPCQDVSSAGRQDLTYGRSLLVKYSLDIIDAKNPQFIIFENVKALASPKFKDFLNYILSRLSRNYFISFKVLNSKDFGVPQHRERIFCIGVKKSINNQSFSFDFGTPEIKETPSLYSILKFNGKIETAFKACNIEIDSKKFYVGAVRTWPRKFKTGAEFNRCKRLELREDTIANCLTTHKLDSLYVQNGNVMSFSTDEIIRLQGFPDSFKTPCSSTATYKQFGNTITVPVLEAIFSKLLKQLKTNREKHFKNIRHS